MAKGIPARCDPPESSPLLDGWSRPPTSSTTTTTAAPIENDDGIILTPTENLNSAKLNSENDHRLFMAFSIVGMYIGDCTVTDPDSVQVSYPNFISDMKNVGAQIIL